MATKISLALCVLGGLFLLSCIFLAYVGIIANYNGNINAAHMLGSIAIVNMISGFFLFSAGAIVYGSKN